MCSLNFCFPGLSYNHKSLLDFVVRLTHSSFPNDLYFSLHTTFNFIRKLSFVELIRYTFIYFLCKKTVTFIFRRIITKIIEVFLPGFKTSFFEFIITHIIPANVSLFDSTSFIV